MAPISSIPEPQSDGPPTVVPSLDGETSSCEIRDIKLLAAAWLLVVLLALNLVALGAMLWISFKPRVAMIFVPCGVQAQPSADDSTSDESEMRVRF